ncbi:MAG: alanine--tRNA ligase [Acidobacteria bacterium]|nr:MAG: alanine--tRNA ligase [Acidobacteriota bacterium]REJ99160.1 MAG: alanine--tRNA ligase [Acidobacteriota bacterium]REK16119.1 MAG: alanine--tRNA ligase [Acidobacteriota bacterium]REK43800.1 MAG: alanine--tRNA ligase [Acidobacteriota bacterium]
MKGSEIRQRFLDYFEERGHRVVHSSPLLPANDPTLLFVNAGMNQFKDVFLGNDKRDYSRAASSQKCIRAGGKHNDLDEVGKTARHHTFFEMLGNFSFGDYFKEDAIEFAWDFLVNKLGLEESRLWFTVFEGDGEVPADEEAEKLWIKAGAKPERVLRFGKKDNFWQMGDTGPCGPCSEIHYFMGDDPEDSEQNRAELVNAEYGDENIEIWNLVFMQFDRSEDGEGGFTLAELPAPSVDTGMGLERIAAVMQGVSTNYETDLIRPIIDFVASISEQGAVSGEQQESGQEDKEGLAHPFTGGTEEGGNANTKERPVQKFFDSFDDQKKFACRVIADHARATAFAIADGILPGNEGRHNVLRKIMRRAIYHGRDHLGFNRPFFNEVCHFVVGEMRDAYPELEAQRGFIRRMVLSEEKRFGNTLSAGSKKYDEILGQLDGSSIDPTSEELFTEAARLLDTFGYPRDLIRVRLEEQGLEFSEREFDNRFDKALADLQASSAVGKTQQAEKISPIYAEIVEKTGRTEFLGYETTRVENSKVTALVKDDKLVNELNEGDEGLIVLDRTPFYAEAGGQVGDRGNLNASGLQIKVRDTFAPIHGVTLHKSNVERGTLRVGDELTASVFEEKRDATRRNHTATHLVHAALKEVLGSHVKQAGSVVAPNYLRFDFTHYQPMSEDEIREIEDLVNHYILENETVNTDLMPIEEAMKSGAVAMFGEKYGSEVRVLSVGDGKFSKELCGGTHVRATGDIGTFKITSDEAIASGVRRIRAITGFDSFKRFREDERLIDRSLDVLKTQRDQLPNAIEKLVEDYKKARKQVEDLKLKIASGAVSSGSSNGDDTRDVAGVKVLAKMVDDLDPSGMRHLSDTLMAKVRSGVVIIGRKGDGKVSFIVRVSDDLTEKVKAGNIIREIAPIVGGRGGGKPDMAEGGGCEPDKLSEAIDASYGVIERMLSS